jgi:AraC-like DNA-binding protein
MVSVRTQAAFDVPRISLCRARAAYLGPALHLAPHENATATIAIALAEPFRLTLPTSTSTYATKAIALIPPNTQHHLIAAGPMAFVYLDALSDDHRQLTVVDLEHAQAAIARAWQASATRLNVETLCAALGVPARDGADMRMVAAIRRLDERPQDYPRIVDLARIVGLSPSRVQSLFRHEAGMPFRRYRLWRRMAVTMRRLASGGSLTHAAHEAGFAGSAHLSATFRAMFGLTPSSLLTFGVRIETTASATHDEALSTYNTAASSMAGPDVPAP